MAEGGFKLPQNADDVKVLARKSGKFAQEKFSEAKEAGAFSYFKEFGKDLIQPIPIAELKDQETLKTIGFGKYPDTAAGFTVALAGTVWLELAGAIFNFLFGASTLYIIFEIVYAALAAYILYFMVTKSPIAKHSEVALYLLVVYTLLNAWETFTSLIFVLPALFIGAKTILCAVATVYSYKIMKSKKNAVQLDEEEMVAQ